MMKEKQKTDSQLKSSEDLEETRRGLKVAGTILANFYKNEWYRNNFPIDPKIVDCRNCNEHSPPTFDCVECVKCAAVNAHVFVSKAKDCKAFTSWLPTAQPKLLAEPKCDKDYPNLQSFFSLAEQLSELDEVIVEEETTKWVPASSLDAKVFDFNDEAVPAALRAIFEILRGMNKRLENIEDKMPTTKRWKLKAFLKRKREKLRLKRISLKWKIIFKLRAIKAKKPKEPLKSLTALFKVESKNKTEKSKSE